VVLILIACAGKGEDSDGPVFEVVGVSPADGTPDAVEAVVPQLHFSEPADLASCAPAGLRVDAVDEAGVVAFPVATSLTTSDEGTKVLLDPADTLPRGWRYTVSAREGACTSVAGRALEPFYSSFTVP
jgi:hypothetical protein